MKQLFDDITHFNIGNLATHMIYDKLNIERCYYNTTKGCIDGNSVQINNARRNNIVEFQERKKFYEYNT